jgi:hypothetical protein
MLRAFHRLGQCAIQNPIPLCEDVALNWSKSNATPSQLSLSVEKQASLLANCLLREQVKTLAKPVFGGIRWLFG